MHRAHLALLVPAVAFAAALYACAINEFPGPGPVVPPNATDAGTTAATGTATTTTAPTDTSSPDAAPAEPPSTTGTPDAAASGTGTSDAATASTSPDAAGTPANAPGDAYTACAKDSDCLAVPLNGCCQNGINVAVASGQAQAYKASFTCARPPICPQFRMNDTRVAECGATRHCEMVGIPDIKCNGFIANAHQCPSGYTCKKAPGVSDGPGSCVQP